METIARNFEALAAFHHVATHSSFSRAAERVNTSKAMLSKQVKQLEAALSAQLFQRSTRKVTLTQEGQALFLYTQKIFALSNEAGKRMQDLAQGMSGSLKLAAPVSLGEILFPPILKELATKIPRVQIEVDLSNDLRRLDDVDFAIRAVDTHHEDSIARPLGRILDAVVVHPQLLKKMPEAPSRLSNFNCIVNSHQKLWNRWTFTRANEDCTIEIQGCISTNHYPMARVFALNGFGIAKLPLYLVSEDIKKGNLLRLFEDWNITTHPLYLTYVRSEYASQKKKITRDIILNWFKSRPQFFSRSAD